MDETGYAQNRKSKKWVVVTGSRNVCSKSVGANLHLTINACVSVNGFVFLPIFIVPRQQLNWDVMNQYKINGSVIYVAQNLFMISKILLKCLKTFGHNFPTIVKISLVLVYEGYGS